MIDTLLFDLGNVLYTFDMSLPKEFLLKHAPDMAPEGLLKLKDRLRAYETGEIDTMEFYRAVKQDTGYTGEFEDFRRAFSNIFRENPDVIPLIPKLEKKYPLFLLSNPNEMHIEHILKHFKALEHFRDVIYSFQVHAAKPDPEIFRRVVERFGVNPETTLFIDDLEKNIAAAEESGFRVLHYPVEEGKPLLNLQDELTKIGIEL